MEKTPHCTYWPVLVHAKYQKDVNMICSSLPKMLEIEVQQWYIRYLTRGIKLQGFVWLKELIFGEIYCFNTSYQGLSEVRGRRIVSSAYKLLKSLNSAALCGRHCGKEVSIKVFSLSAPPPFRCFLMLPFKTV